ncbi:Hypothetical predicted protein [Pelobates cultripes]|uniref:Uncharacterized protein n=1 Tax=Pelobates cultripes TaxID=61616 RepID=A0AAD1W5Y9_PELCU|nr:Hypothetical predicted protein [Pelobates cultripes]
MLPHMTGPPGLKTAGEAIPEHRPPALGIRCRLTTRNHSIPPQRKNLASYVSNLVRGHGSQAFTQARGYRGDLPRPCPTSPHHPPCPNPI